MNMEDQSIVTCSTINSKENQDFQDNLSHAKAGVLMFEKFNEGFSCIIKNTKFLPNPDSIILGSVHQTYFYQDLVKPLFNKYGFTAELLDSNTEERDKTRAIYKLRPAT